MFARISFESGQRVTIEEKVALDKIFGDTVSFTELVKREDGDLTEFSTWSNHSFDPQEVKDSSESEKPKKLVFKTNMVQLEYAKEYLSELELFMTKFPQLKIKVRGMVQMSEDSSLNMVTKMMEVQSKLDRSLSAFNEKVEFNQKCDVHISNLGLLSINQLGFATDKCTEELQELLNQGWRLLAICPQPDQRRPDYILGKSMPSSEEGYRVGEVHCAKF